MNSTWIILIVYFIASIYFTIIVIRSDFDKQRKKLNIIMIWLIPIIWGLLIRIIIKPLKPAYKKYDKSNYYESGIGLTGGEYLT